MTFRDPDIVHAIVRDRITQTEARLESRARQRDVAERGATVAVAAHPTTVTPTAAKRAGLAGRLLAFL